VTALRNRWAARTGSAGADGPQTLGRDENGNLVSKPAFMGVVWPRGMCGLATRIHVELPPQPHRPLAQSEPRPSGVRRVSAQD